MSFRINTDGTVSIFGVRGTDKLLEEEAKRIIKSIPKLIPGKQRGKPTPITFASMNESRKEQLYRGWKKAVKATQAFAEIDD